LVELGLTAALVVVGFVALLYQRDVFWLVGLFAFGGAFIGIYFLSPRHGILAICTALLAPFGVLTGHIILAFSLREPSIQTLKWVAIFYVVLAGIFVLHFLVCRRRTKH
jgi:hypothetical protein